MNLTEEQIKSIKDEAAKELGWAELFAGASETILKLRYKKWFEDIIERCMQLSYQQAMKDVESKLPDLIADLEGIYGSCDGSKSDGLKEECLKSGTHCCRTRYVKVIEDLLNKLRKQ